VKEWWTPAELAECGLPDMPGTDRAIQLMADRQSWRAPDREFPANPNGVWRRRAGRGGGYEYRLDVLPLRARVRLSMQARTEAVATPVDAKAEVSREEMWRWFDQLPETKKTQARQKLDALEAVRDLTQAGTERDVAMQLVAAEAGISLRTLYNWQREVHGVDRADWLPYLAPRRVGRQSRSDCSPGAWEWFKGAYLRQAEPSAAHCYRQLQQVASQNGWTIPSCKTLERRIAAIDVAQRTYLRKGPEALKRLYPAQERDRSIFHALEAVNADGYKWDVFVRWPDGEVTRPCMVAFQDLYSGKVLSWRVDKTENKHMVRLAFGDLVEGFGIPDHAWLDNGRGFASKWITGGAPTRFRFKVKDEEPDGVMTALGIEVHWTTPYSGQSKPIERAFKDFAQNIARDVRFEGAWTGNTVAAKPENYGSRAVPLELFLQVVAEGIVEHNTRVGRRTKVCAGRSFEQSFAASYEQAPIRHASEAQRRLWLLASELVSARKPDGAVYLGENRYWAECLTNQIGRKVVLRFDPQAFHDGVHVYRPDGAYLGFAPCLDAVGFADAEMGRAHARARAAWLKGMKAAAQAERRLSSAQVAAMLPQVEPPERPEAKVVRPVFGNLAVAVAAPDTEHDQDAVLADFGRAVAKLTVARKQDGADD
jgi:putative transposase